MGNDPRIVTYKTEDAKTQDMEVVNEALITPYTIEFGPTQRLMLDACGCTGNSFCNDR